MRFILVLLLLISVTGYSQPWKSYIISVKGDTLNRVDMKGRKQGPWVIKVESLRGERGYEEEGYFENDQKTGEWKRFSLEGVKIAEENYSWGKLNGRQRYYTYNGGLLREESWRAMDPANAYDTVSVYDVNDPTREVDRVIVKNEGFAMKHGKWIYYDPREGTIEETENYVMNKLQTADGLYGDDDIKPLKVSTYQPKTDSLGNKVVTKPKEILEFEKKNSGKKKVKVRDGSTGN